MALLLLRRLRDLLVVLLIVGTVMFFIIRLIPGDAALALLGNDATPEQIQDLRESLGLAGPIHQQYLQWIGRVLRADLGNSITLHAPVIQLVLQHSVPTLALAIICTVIAFTVAVAVTCWNAVRPGNPVARVLYRSTSIAIAIPEFWIALVLIYVFGLVLGWLPTGGYVNPFVDPLGAAPYYVLPAVSIVIGLSAMYILILRESVLREMTRLYLRTARSKGLGELAVVFRHVLRNAMLPCLTVMGTSFARMIGGVVLIEAIFVIPGLGSLLLDAIGSRDYPLVQGVTIFIAFLFVVVNMLVDLLYLFLDPKLRVS